MGAPRDRLQLGAQVLIRTRVGVHARLREDHEVNVIGDGRRQVEVAVGQVAIIDLGLREVAPGTRLTLGGLLRMPFDR